MDRNNVGVNVTVRGYPGHTVARRAPAYFLATAAIVAEERALGRAAAGGFLGGGDVVVFTVYPEVATA